MPGTVFSEPNSGVLPLGALAAVPVLLGFHPTVIFLVTLSEPICTTVPYKINGMSVR